MTAKNTQATSERGSHDDEADQIFAALTSLAHGLQATLGQNAEVVVHDFRRGANAAIAVAGDVTHRSVGSSVSTLGLSLIERGDEAEDQLNVVSRLPSGRVMKSSIMLVRLQSRRIVGAFSVNIDVTELRIVNGILSDLSGQSESSEPSPIDFSNDVEAVIGAILDGIEKRRGRPLTTMTREERLEAFAELEERGVFQFRNAAKHLAKGFGISRTTIYNYRQGL